MEHELGTVLAMEPNPHSSDSCVNILQSGAPHDSGVAEGEDLDGSLDTHRQSPANPDGDSAGASHPIAILQPALARSASRQLSQALIFNNNRSMSNLFDNSSEIGALEYERAEGHRNRMRASVTQHYRAGRYQPALESFMSHHRMYISIVTFMVMFGMTFAGLWLEIAGSHQTDTLRLGLSFEGGR